VRDPQNALQTTKNDKACGDPVFFLGMVRLRDDRRISEDGWSFPVWPGFVLSQPMPKNAKPDRNACYQSSLNDMIVLQSFRYLLPQNGGSVADNESD
jgi:hypothetical protein